MAMGPLAKVVILQLVIISVGTLGGNSQSTSCTTPSKRQGQCVPIRRCRNIYDLETGPANKRQKYATYIARAACTLPNVERSVCCQLAEIVAEVVTQKPLPPVVTQHPKTNLLPKECGMSTSDRISYANGTKVFEYPWMAVLQYNENKSIVDGCGGTLINKRYILTAAHCIKTKSGLQLANIRLGEHTKNLEEDCIIYRDNNGVETERDCADPVEDYGIESFVFHPEYNRPRFSNDIGLIRLDRDVVMQDHIHPICLPVMPELRTKLLPRYIVTGWGTTENQTGSDALLQATVNRVHNSECQPIMNRNRLNIQLSDKQICAGGQDQVDTCKGDSGGPLGFNVLYGSQSRFVQFGVISAGVNSCGYRSVPGVYCLVGSYMDWILDNMEP